MTIFENRNGTYTRVFEYRKRSKSSFAGHLSHFVNRSLNSKRFLFIACATAATLTACSPQIRSHGPSQYWQRANVSESIYLRGPKAQQMLNRDIARCVTQLRELERLGVLKNAIPTGFDGRVLGQDGKELMDWDTPERDRNLFAEHTNYHDFEGCMSASGWERTEHVPYDVMVRAQDVYLEEQIKYRYESRIGKSKRKRTSQDVGDYGSLNE